MSRSASPSHPGGPDRGLEIRVLGPLEVLANGTPLVVDTRKALAILVLLAVDGRPYAREELAAMLWPDADDESARGALRRTLSVLRSALGDRWLSVDRSVVALDRAGLRLDLAELEAGAAAGDLASLEAAVDLARGPFLAGFSLRDSVEFDDWRATRASAVERHVMALLERCADVAEASGNQDTAIRAARRLADLDPLDEAARRRLMALLARQGDRAGAIREYRAAVAVLERELGVPALAETTQLYEAIRDGRLEGLPIAGRQPVPATSPDLPAAAAPPERPLRLPMVAREPDLRRILAAHAAARPDGRLAVISGEAGVGKSRLVEAAAGVVAAAGGRVAMARAFPAEVSIAFAPIAELLRSGFGLGDAAGRLRRLPASTLREVERIVALPDGLEPGTAPVPWPAGDQPAARARLLDAVADVLTALVSGRGPGLVVVEDVHWADDASREALLYLARRLTTRPLLLLLTWRPEDLDDRGRAFSAAVEGLARVEALTLGRLPAAAVAELVVAAQRAGMPAWDADRLAAESEGLALYVVEALAAGPPDTGDGVPRGVRTLLRERLSSVGEAAGQVLSAAAVIGRTFDLATVRGVSGRTEDETVTALEELMRRGLVREVGKGGEPAYDFGHARLREAAYEAIGLARRRLLHRRVAEILRAHPAGRDDPGRLAVVAEHERAAGRTAEAAEAYRDAAARARAVYANREALAHLRAALALGHPDTVKIHVEIGELCTSLGDYPAAIAALETAAALAPADDLPAIELRLGRVHARRGDAATAASHLDAALELLDEPGRTAAVQALASALVERGAVGLRAGDLATAHACGVRALGIATDAGDTRAMGAAHRLLGLEARARDDLGEARAALRRSVEEAGADPDPGAAIAARNALALVEAAAGDRATAIALLEEALADCRRTGETHLEAAVENNLADQLHAAGRPEEAMHHLKRAVSLFAEVGGGPGELEPEIWKLVTW